MNDFELPTLEDFLIVDDQIVCSKYEKGEDLITFDERNFCFICKHHFLCFNLLYNEKYNKCFLFPKCDGDLILYSHIAIYKKLFQERYDIDIQFLCCGCYKKNKDKDWVDREKEITTTSVYEGVRYTLEDFYNVSHSGYYIANVWTIAKPPPIGFDSKNDIIVNGMIMVGAPYFWEPQIKEEKDTTKEQFLDIINMFFSPKIWGFYDIKKILKELKDLVNK